MLGARVRMSSLKCARSVALWLMCVGVAIRVRAKRPHELRVAFFSSIGGLCGTRPKSCHSGTHPRCIAHPALQHRLQAPLFRNSTDTHSSSLFSHVTDKVCQTSPQAMPEDVETPSPYNTRTTSDTHAHTHGRWAAQRATLFCFSCAPREWKSQSARRREAGTHLHPSRGGDIPIGPPAGGPLGVAKPSPPGRLNLENAQF